MAEQQQSSSFLVLLCLVLAALLGSTRSQDAAAPAMMVAMSPEMMAMSPEAMMAPAPAPMAAAAPMSDMMMAPAAAPAAAPTVAPVLATAPAPDTVTATAGYASTRRSGPPPNCVSEAMSLTANNAPCHDLINSLRGSIPSGSAAANADMSTIKAAVANAPTPSSSCCSAVRSFINDGCSCDQNLLNLLPMVNVQPSQIQFAVKATQYSACADSDNGGWISNPCDDSSSGSAGR